MVDLVRSATNRQTQVHALVELVATFFLTLAALLSGTPVAVALTLTFFVYAIGNISGAHLNPAVTIGLMANRRFGVGTGILYIIAQIAGALLARLIAGFAVETLPALPEASGVLLEFLGFGFLMIAVAAVTTEQHVPAAGSGLVIGAGLLAGLLTSKGILNPAVAIASSETLSAATWATVLSGIVFTALFGLFTRRYPAEPRQPDA